MAVTPLGIAVTGCARAPGGRDAAACQLTRSSPHAPLESLLTPTPFSATAVYDEYGRLSPLATPCSAADCAAVVSFRFRPDDALGKTLGRRSFVYDDALALIAATSRGHFADARRLGNTLSRLITPKGWVGYSFNLEAPAYYDREYLRTGATAWVGYALALYDLATGEKRFAAAAQTIADALLAARIDDRADPRFGLIPAGYGRWVEHYRTFESLPMRFCAMEHQIDAYFLLDALATLIPEGGYRLAANRLAAAMLARLWLEDEGRFAVAVDERGPVRARALDAAGAWGTLFLLARGERGRAERAIDFTLRHFATRGQHYGFAPYAGEFGDYPGVDFSTTLFSEGTAGVGVALRRLGRHRQAARVAAALRGLEHHHGGIPYALPPREDFPDALAVAPSAWLLFLELELDGGPPVLFAPLGPPASTRVAATPRGRSR